MIAGNTSARKLLLCILLYCATIPITSAAGFNPIRAYWKEYETSLALGGFDFADYSCRSIKYKVSDLLHVVGVREDFKIAAEGCLLIHKNVQDTLIYVRLKFHALLPPPEKDEDPETEDEPDTEDAESEPQETPEELRRRSFPTKRVQVRLAWRKSLPIERGDCTLLQRFRQRVLPHVPHQVVADPTCDPEAPVGPGLRVLAPVR